MVPSGLLSLLAFAMFALGGACGGGGGAAAGGGGGTGGGGGGGGPGLCNAATFGVQLAELSLRVTKNGGGWETPPNVQLLGRGATVDADEFAAVWTASHDDAGLYRVTVPVGGPYDVLMNAGGDFHGPLATNVQVQRDTTLSFDYQTVVVSGTVRLQGGTFPAESGTKGAVLLTREDAAPYVYRTDIGDGTFRVEVPRGGTYEMSWSRGATLDSGAALSEVPYGVHIFGTRTFAEDTTLDLNIDAPSFVVSATVLADGKPLAGSARISIGPVTIAVASAAVSSFAVRMLGGSYTPMVFLETAGSTLPLLWPTCVQNGCTLTSDAEWRIDLPLSGPPAGVVEGTLTFAAASPAALPPPAGESMGSITLTAIALHPAVYTGFHAVTTFQARVDAAGAFQLPNVPYGTFQVRYTGSALASAPAGSFDFPSAVVVDRERVDWSQTVPLTPVEIRLTVNGQEMADDSLLDELHEPRGALQLYRDGDAAFSGLTTLDLGETGPARLRRWMVPGRYRAALQTWTYLGRTHLRGYQQDVLPVGRVQLDAMEVLPAGDGQLQSFTRPLALQTARLQIRGADLLATASASRTMIRLSRPNGDLLWADVPADGRLLDVPAYAGCYDLDVFVTDLAGYPDRGVFGTTRTARLGNSCTCD